MRIRDGGAVRELRYRFRGQGLRIDRPGEVVPSPPVNLLDFEKGTLSILHPHNATWEQVRVDATNGSGSAVDPVPFAPPPAIPEPARPEYTQPTNWPDRPALPDDVPPGIGPRPPGTTPASSPGFPPPVAAGMMPGTPAGMPPGMPVMPGMSAMSGMPAFPPMPLPGEAEPMELTCKGRTNDLYGFSCRLHELTVPDWGTMSLWLSDDPGLPPFHLLRHEAPRSHGRMEWFEKVAALLSKKRMFPFHAELKGEGNDALATWKVLSVTPLPGADDAALFSVPETFDRVGAAE